MSKGPDRGEFPDERRAMVAAVRAGASLRAVARRHQVSPATVQLWLRRAADQPLERVDWSDRPSVPGRISRTQVDVEDRILDLRRMLREESALGEYGPAAIHRVLEDESDLTGPIPAVRTIALFIGWRFGAFRGDEVGAVAEPGALART